MVKSHTQSYCADSIRNEKKFNLEVLKAIPTSCSITHFKQTCCYHKYFKRRSKSYEDKKLNANENLIQGEILQWWLSYKGRKDVTKWEEKLLRLSEKLKKPGGEEELRIKIQKYLKKETSFFADCDKDFKELPDDVIKALKKYSLCKDTEHQANFGEIRLHVPKYEKRKSGSNYKEVITRWLQGLTTNNSVVKDNIVEFIVHKIEPFIVDEPEFNAEFRFILKSNLIDIINEIPIVIDSKYKSNFLNRKTDDLIEDLLNMSRSRGKSVATSCELDVHSSQCPIEADIVKFVHKEFTNFIKSSKVCISAWRIYDIERELANIFINAVHSLTSKITEKDISSILHNVGQLSGQQTQEFSNKIIARLKTTFLDIDNNHYYNYINSHKLFTNTIDSDKTYNVEKLTTTTIEREIEKWLQANQTLGYESTRNEKTAIKDMAANILKNKNKYQNSFKNVEYQALRWFTKLYGKNKIKNINLHDFVENVIRIIYPAEKTLRNSMGVSVVYQNADIVSGPSTQREVPFIEELMVVVLDWFHELPYEVVGSVDASLDNHLIRELAENIYFRLLSKENTNLVIDSEVDAWLLKILATNPNRSSIEKLKKEIKNVNFRKKAIHREFLDKDLLKLFEDTVSAWLDKLRIDPVRKDDFIKSKSKLVVELAARLYEMKKTQGDSTNDSLTKNMKREVADWLLKVPIHPRHNINTRRYVMAKMLIDVIKELIFNHEKETVTDPGESLTECDILDWLKVQLFYIDSNASDKLKQEEYVIGLGNILNEMKNGRLLDMDVELSNCVKSLDLRQEFSNDFVQQTFRDLKWFVQNAIFGIVRNEDDKSLTEVIEQWLHGLPLNITSEQETNMVECIVKELVGVIKDATVNDSGGKEKLLEAIRKIIKVLPIECKTKCNELFLIHHSKSLLHELNKIDKLGLKINESVENEDTELRSSSKNIERTAEFNVDNYMIKLTEQIEDWLNKLQLPLHEEKGLKVVVINELAKDIIDREKYLEINPSSRGTDIEELDHLKFQVFKWINKLVGEDNLKTVEYTPELMQRIRSINNQRAKSASKTRVQLGAGPSSNHRSGSMHYEVNEMPILGLPGRGGSYVEGGPKNMYNNRFSNPLGYPVDYKPKNFVNSDFNASVANIFDQSNSPNLMQQAISFNENGHKTLNPAVHFEQQTPVLSRFNRSEVVEVTTVEQIYKEYDKVYWERSDEIPLEVSTQEEQIVANYIRQGIVNIIWNTYFKLKSNPEVENDYSYVALIMEEALEEIFNDLPTTAAITRVKHNWIVTVIQDVIAMLEKVHNITDTDVFKILLASKGHRVTARAVYQESSDYLRNYFVITTTDMYLTLKNENFLYPMRWNIYKLRLTNHIEYLVNSVEFYGITNDQLSNIRLRVLSALDNVPLPGTDILTNEISEVEIGNIIENWFNDLPGIIPKRAAVEHVWKRLRQKLAKKIALLEMKVYAEEFDLERIIMHETTLFLESPDLLCNDNDLHINYMIKELLNRLRKRRQNQVLPIIQGDPNMIGLLRNSGQEKQSPVAHLTNISPHAPLNLSRRDESLSSQQAHTNRQLMVANEVEPPHGTPANIIDKAHPVPLTLLNTVQQIKQVRENEICHENIATNIPFNHLTSVVARHTSQVEDPDTSRQVLDNNEVVNVLSSQQGRNNQSVQYSGGSRSPQVAVDTPRHELSHTIISNRGGQLFVHNIPTQIDVRPEEPIGQIYNSQLINVSPTDEIPVTSLIRQTQLDTEYAVISSQEALPSSRPASTHRTQSTVRVGDDVNVINEVKKSKRLYCKCNGICRCRRQKYTCSCENYDCNDEDVIYVPCKYSF